MTQVRRKKFAQKETHGFSIGYAHVERRIKTPGVLSAESGNRSVMPRFGSRKRAPTVARVVPRQKPLVVSFHGMHGCSTFSTLDDALRALSEHPPSSTAPLWIDIGGIVPPAEMGRFAAQLGIHPLTSTDCLQPDSPPKWELFDRYLFLVIYSCPPIDSDEPNLAVEIDAIVMDSLFITFHTDPEAATQKMHAILDAALAPSSGPVHLMTPLHMLLSRLSTPASTPTVPFHDRAAAQPLRLGETYTVPALAVPHLDEAATATPTPQPSPHPHEPTVAMTRDEEAAHLALIPPPLVPTPILPPVPDQRLSPPEAGSLAAPTPVTAAIASPDFSPPAASMPSPPSSGGSQGALLTPIPSPSGFAKTVPRLDTSVLLYLLLDSCVNSYMADVDRLLGEVDNLDELIQTLSFEQDDLLMRLNMDRRAVTTYRRRLLPVRDILTALTRDNIPQISLEIRRYLRDVGDHVSQMIDKLDSVRESVNNTHSNYLAQLSLDLSRSSTRMNSIMKQLTMVSTIFMPLNLIAGMWV
ncbi:putative magnesium and cobalt transport protein CorA [Paratrimastix pyriformis]|uniref:Magnesium and cobalt transport protein CorA n=1 Tax=Paratrimastix pyriformis TaxID=342808 RepID=A0ABQ8UYZ5_9EUKA|nr:putative magnesium and cobalt transport protein CorA [Paratrimastix pyriformis]